MPAENETTAVTVSATMPDSATVNEPRKVETKKLPIAETIEKNTEVTETTDEGKHEEEKNTNVVEQKESKSKDDESKDDDGKDDEDKENVHENRNSTKVDQNNTDADKTSNAEAAGQTGGAVLRKRQTPEKKESTEEDVSPPKKVK